MFFHLFKQIRYWHLHSTLVGHCRHISSFVYCLFVLSFMVSFVVSWFVVQLFLHSLLFFHSLHGLCIRLFDTVSQYFIKLVYNPTNLTGSLQTRLTKSRFANMIYLFAVLRKYHMHQQCKNMEKGKQNKKIIYLSWYNDFIKSFISNWTLFFISVIKSNCDRCLCYSFLATLVNQFLQICCTYLKSRITSLFNTSK